MKSDEKFLNKIFEINNTDEFTTIALELFIFQYENNSVYRQFCTLINKVPDKVTNITDIPFLPISFFKTHRIQTKYDKYSVIFESSGTTSNLRSKHFVYDLSIYEKSFISCFEKFYGNIQDYTILALMPSLNERPNSSLAYMLNRLIELNKNVDSSFYGIDKLDDLKLIIEKLKQQNKRTILFGLSFALLDFVKQHKIVFPDLIVIETGGMKRHGKEITRQEIIEHLSNGLGTKNIHSEYGMTELLSQAYSYGNNVFNCPPWMKVLIRDLNDPFTLLEVNKTGAINIIDLANVYSCCFIATDDLGKKINDESFEILGRIEGSDNRGCNSLI